MGRAGTGDLVSRDGFSYIVVRILSVKVTVRGDILVRKTPFGNLDSYAMSPNR